MTAYFELLLHTFVYGENSQGAATLAKWLLVHVSSKAAGYFLFALTKRSLEYYKNHYTRVARQ